MRTGRNDAGGRGAGEAPRDLGEAYRVLYAGRWFIVAFVLAAAAVGVWLNARMDYTYRATATAMVVSNSPWESGLLLESRGSVPSFSVADQLQILTSRKLARAVVEEVAADAYADRLYLLGWPDAPASLPVERASQRLLKALSVKQVMNSNVVSISVDAPSGFEAAYLANRVAQRFHRQNQEFSRAEYTELTEFLKSQLDDVTQRLQSAEARLTSFKEGSKLSALDVETATIVAQSASAQSELNRIEIELQSNEVTLTNLRRQYSLGQSSLVEDIENLSTATIEQLSREIADKQAQIANIRARGEAGWEEYVSRLEGELRQIKGTLKAETVKLSASEMRSADPLGTMQSTFERIVGLEVDNKALRAARAAQTEVVARFDQRLSQLPEASLEYARFTREVEINEKLYRMLMEKHQENQAVAAGMIGNVRLLDEAEVPGAPIRPNKRLNLLVALVLGLLLGVGVSIVYRSLDTRIVTPDDLRPMGLTLIGAVPTINIRKLEQALRAKEGTSLREEDAWKIQRKLITHFSPKSPISEAYRSLRTTMLMRLEQEKLAPPAGSGRAPAVIVTSSTTQEGKSLTSANLAVALAQTGRRVLVIDADMRRPTAHKNFAIERSEGLSGVLSGQYEAERAISETDIEQLFVLSAGPIPSNPAELLAGERMVRLLDWARQNFEFVLIDTPPVVPVTDPTVLSRLVDAVLLVVRSNSSHRRELNEALSKLDHSDCHVMGFVLNDYNLKRVYGSYYYYYHYYNRYYYYGDRKKKKRRSEAGTNPRRRSRRHQEA
jgi:capsular exopolysaccharide synthesis family protein